MNSLSGLYNAQRAMTLNQAGLSIVSNNIANMNTVGYSKQRLESAALVLNSNPSTLYERAEQGMGAYIESITRNRDVYLDQNYRNENSKLNYYSNYSDMAGIVENFVNDLDDTGLTKTLENFYSSAQTLSTKPTDSVARIDFINQAESVADYLNKTSSELNEYRESLVGNINDASSFKTCQAKTTTDTVNDLLSQIVQINKDISTQSLSAGDPNGLLDQRDNLLDELSQYIPVNVTELPNNSCQVSVGSVVLIKNGEQNGFLQATQGTDEDNPAIVSIVDKDGDVITEDITKIADSGSLTSILKMGGSSSTDLSIKNILDKLDLFASSFAQEVNDIQLKYELGPPGKTSACLDSAAATQPSLKTATQNIFVNGGSTEDNDATGITASNIKINSTVKDDPNEVATAYVKATNVSTDPDVVEMVVDNPLEVGNNETALAFAELRDEGVPALDNLTTEKYLAQLIGDVGVKTEKLNSNYETEQTVFNQAKTTRTNLTGVNLDEELTDLIKYQRAYEASAKVFNVINEILEQTINMT